MLQFSKLVLKSVRMEVSLSPADLTFRDEVRGFLSEAFTPELRKAAGLQIGVFAEPELGLRWHRILNEKGWAAPTWPKRYGGPGWSQMQRYIFDMECAEAGTPVLSSAALRMVGPVLMRFGTETQKAYFLPRILSGEDYWCQGYSEPQAGSDLAALRCRAVPDGDDYLINGTKIWTTHAQFANWIFLLVRTANSDKPQTGITFLLAPMDAPGITIRPIQSLSGEHEVNQVFFDDVRIPIENRVGEENHGWEVAKYLLEFERGGAYAARIKRALKLARLIAERESDGHGAAYLANPLFQASLADAEIDLLAIDLLERQIFSAAPAGESIGDVAASLIKLQGTEALQRATEIAVEALGPRGLIDYYRLRQSDADSPALGPDYVQTPVALYLNKRAATIYGGSSEIQRNILAKVWLGL